MKHKYNITELNYIGILDIDTIVDEAHRRYVGLQSQDKDSEQAFKIYLYIVENNVCSLQVMLEYVFKNNLWSSWRRGQATFKDLLKENCIRFRNEN